jgi:hypothetical protein
MNESPRWLASETWHLVSSEHAIDVCASVMHAEGKVTKPCLLEVLDGNCHVRPWRAHVLAKRFYIFSSSRLLAFLLLLQLLIPIA